MINETQATHVTYPPPANPPAAQPPLVNVPATTATAAPTVTSGHNGHTGSTGSWSDPEHLARVRRATGRGEVRDMKRTLIRYTEIVEILHSRYRDMRPSERSEWALAMALRPENYGEQLAARLQRQMIVAALLLTVTSVLFVGPPLGDQNDDDFRVFIYFTFITNACFVMSLLFGTFFIDNALNRGYTDADRYALIIHFNIYKELCQIFMGIGTLLFPILLGIPMWDRFLDIDADVIIAFTAFYVATCIIIWIVVGEEAKAEQRRRLQELGPLIDPSTSRLNAAYYPNDAEVQPDGYKAMYTH